MAKFVKEQRLTIIITLTKVGDAPAEVTCRADYEVGSDDLVVNRSYEPTLTGAQKTTIKNFGALILEKIKQLEEVL